MRKNISIAFVICLSFITAASQDYNWKEINTQQKDQIIKRYIDTLKNSKNPDHKTKGLMNLVEQYILIEENDSLQRKMERIFIGTSNSSVQYFFHEFEISFNDFLQRNLFYIRNNQPVKIKTAKILLILSCRFDEIDKSVYLKAKDLLKKDLSIPNFDCSKIPKDKSQPTYYEDLARLSSHFFEILISCPNEFEYLKLIKLHLFFSLNNP